MKLRQKSKRDQALDATASIAKTWSEWRLGEKVSKTANKAGKGAGKVTKKAKKSASGGSKRKPAAIAGMIALVGGIGAAVAKKLKGGKAEPLYTPPGPAPDMAPPPPSAVAVEDLTKDPPSDRSTIEGTTVPPTVEPAHTASTEVPQREPSPVVVDDLAGGSSADAESEQPEAASLADDDAPIADDDAPITEHAHVPGDLTSGSADPARADEDD